MHFSKQSCAVLVFHCSICPGICRLLFLALSTRSVEVTVLCIVILQYASIVLEKAVAGQSDQPKCVDHKLQAIVYWLSL